MSSVLGNHKLHVLALVLLVLALFAIGLGNRPYSVPSESRYVEIGREMAESGDFVTPRLDYAKYFEKPPLFYWLQASATKYLGLDNFSARLPTALFAVFLCLVTYALGAVVYGHLAGVLGASVLATSLYMFALSRIVLLDVPVSFFIVATLTAFIYAVNAPDGRRRTLVLYGMYAAAACAVLTKGLIGAVLPGVVVFIWLLLTNNWKILRNIRLPAGILLFLLIAVPWHVLVSMRNPEFPYFYFIHEHFDRYLTKAHGRYQPVWFFAVIAVAGLFPWVVFAFQALHAGLRDFWKVRYQDGTPLFFVLWIGIIFVFFSLSDSKLIPYILPVFPPVTVLIGRYFSECWQGKPSKFFGTGVLLIIFSLLLLAVIPMLLPGLLDDNSKVVEALKQGSDDIHNLSIVSMIAAGVILVAYIQGQKKHLIMSLVVVAAVIVQFGDSVAGHYDKDSTLSFVYPQASLASTITTFDQPGDEVAVFGEYYQDLPVYLKRRVTVVDWEATELAFGAQHENASAWMIDEKEFWKRWLAKDHLMFVVMRGETYSRLIQGKKPKDLHLYQISENGRNMLFINNLPEAPKK